MCLCVFVHSTVVLCFVISRITKMCTPRDSFFYSSDITPNGTLRRRRSRIPCEDDDGNLMDFLRTSGQDNTRERKSWGSLGILMCQIRYRIWFDSTKIKNWLLLIIIIFANIFYRRSIVGAKSSRTIAKRGSFERRFLRRSGTAELAVSPRGEQAVLAGGGSEDDRVNA